MWKRFVRNRNRRSPLTSDLLRTPGFGLQDQIEELTHDISGDVLGTTWVPLVFFAIYQFKPGGKITALLFAVTALSILIRQTVTLIRRADERQKYREALAGELATAQLLEPVVAYGGRVLHDIQAPGFNIDHVVVAAGGVFAVETEHRLKSTKGKAMEQAKVRYDGKALHFPSWVETKPVEQARAQARWLSGRLSKATGLSVRARPVIALPGWFVEQTSSSDVVATNPKAFRFMLKPRPNEALLATDTIRWSSCATCRARTKGRIKPARTRSAGEKRIDEESVFAKCMETRMKQNPTFCFIALGRFFFGHLRYPHQGVGRSAIRVFRIP